MKKYIKKNKILLAVVLVGMFFSALVELWKAYLMGYMLDQVNNVKHFNLTVIALQVVVFLIVFWFVSCMVLKLECLFQKKCLTEVKADFFTKILSKTQMQFRKNNTSVYLSNFTNDINLLETDYFDSLFLILNSGICFIVAFIAIINKSIWFIVFIAVTSGVPPLINKLLKGRLAKAKMKFSEEHQYFTGTVNEYMRGFDIIQLYGMKEKIKNAFKSRNQNLEESRYKTRVVDGVCEYSSFTVSLGIWLGSTLLGVFLVSQGKMTIGSVLMVGQLQNSIVNPLYRWSFYNNKLNAMRTTFQKIEETYQDEFIEKLEHEKDYKVSSYGKVDLKENKFHTVKDDGAVLSDQDIKFKNSIEFKNVSLELEGKKILNSVSFTLEKDKKHLFIGESGSGKSTILKLLMRYYNDYTGEILVDGISIRALPYEKWMKHLSVITQDVFLFQDTIKENILLGRKENDVELSRSLEESAMNQVIEKLDFGMDSIVEEEGKNLSGGEKQRISIARAFYLERDILLLDEATSALDLKNAKEVENNILKQNGHTIISIMHKVQLEDQRKFDVVFEVNEGQLKVIKKA